MSQTGDWKETENCRFGLPFYPMKETMILSPLVDNIDIIGFNKKKVDLIKSGLTSMEQMLRNDNTSLDDMTSTVISPDSAPTPFVRNNRVNV